MIPHDKMSIQEFSYIDRLNEGLGSIKPNENEEFIGRRDYCGTHDVMYIERWRDGRIHSTINCEDVSWVLFMPQKD